uniref:Uncharacterized protein n=1 Tax=Klebsiella pneumoniae TaxID=573 RepID=A0A6H0ACZ2_KLEPN|nr:hypothetical protein [Klebsiella pneumoniae]
MLAAACTGRNPGFSLEEDTYDLFFRKIPLYRDVLMWFD